MKKRKKIWASSQNNLYIRIVAGGYVAYLGYQIFKDRDPLASGYMFFMICAFLFMVIGAGVITLSVKMLMKKEYGPIENEEDQDISEQEETNVEE